MKVKLITKKEKETEKVNYPVNNPREYLAIGKVYNVYGIFFLQGRLKYLTVGTYRKEGEYESTLSWEPGAISWEPAELFELVNGKLPPEWYYNCAEKDFPKDKLIDPNFAIWGYEELVNDINHNDRLMEREPDAIKIFYKRKREIDDWEENRSSN